MCVPSSHRISILFVQSLLVQAGPVEDVEVVGLGITLTVTRHTPIALHVERGIPINVQGHVSKGPSHGVAAAHHALGTHDDPRTVILEERLDKPGQTLGCGTGCMHPLNAKRGEEGGL